MNQIAARAKNRFSPLFMLNSAEHEILSVHRKLSTEYCLKHSDVVFILLIIVKMPTIVREHSGSVVECLTRDRGAEGSSLTGVTALWSLSKTHLS